MPKRDNRLKLGLSEGLSRKEVLAWLQNNLSEKATYDLNLTQLSSGDYTIDMELLMKFEGTLSREVEGKVSC